MSGNAHDANARAFRRFVTVLIARLADEIDATAPEGLTVTAPDEGSYYVLPSESAVRRYTANGNPRIYVIPSGRRTRANTSGSGVAYRSASGLPVSVIGYVLDEVGAPGYVETYKTLYREEREMQRSEALMGAAQNAIDRYIGDGTDVLKVDFAGSQSGVETFKVASDEPGTWWRLDWIVTQILTIPQQTSI